MSNNPVMGVTWWVHSAGQAYAELPASYRNGLTRTRALALYRSLPRQTHGLEVLGSALGVPA